ncbi:dienelactone hydrolase family protein [Pseudokineococcus sp. 5B2Z-1]|uniref:dienelactone hydrolase family protein n=1 Tax=Pseudokineococcus sp. 5B2Z-1 TaxID=3132744 RepID=UPI0030AD3F08
MSDPGAAPQNTTFPRPGGEEGHGYLELPPSGRGPGLVVVQEWWGLTEHIADLVRRFAAEGFVALAPDLYGGRTTHDGEEAMRLMQELPVDRAARDLAGAVDLLLGHEAVTSSTVGVAGFCMGGSFALTLAAQQGERVGAVTPFYGLPDPDGTDWSGVRAAVQGHYAREDRIDLDVVGRVFDDLRERLDVPVELHVYEAQHAFVNDTGPAYDADAAALAWGRATAFLREHVR